MFKYLFLLQVLLAGELCFAKTFPTESYFPSVGHIAMSDNENSTNVKGYFVGQILNHFDPTDMVAWKNYWKQRVLVNDEHYRPGGPVFVMIDPASADPERLLTSGAWIEYAKLFGALCVYIEHRYYGLSRPTVDTSTENLKYLTTEQALADVDRVMSGISYVYQLPKDAKWIAFGGGYSGSLAAWLRLKYPHLIHGAVASSAPLTFMPIFYEFYEGIEELLSNYGKECVSAVKDAFVQVSELLQDRSGQEEAAKMFHYCGGLPREFSSEDIAFFKEHLATWLAETVMQNDSTSSTHSSLCDVMTNETVGSPLHRLAYFREQEFYTPDYCVGAKYYDDIHNPLLVDWRNLPSAVGARQRLYQLCTEFGLFQVSSPSFGDTSFDAGYVIRKCSDTFGPKYDNRLLHSGIWNTHKRFGRTDNIDVTNVVFVQGSADPWYPLGVKKNVSSQAPAIVIKGALHCADMAPESPQDTPELKAARKEIAANIGTWLEK